MVAVGTQVVVVIVGQNLDVGTQVAVGQNLEVARTVVVVQTMCIQTVSNLVDVQGTVVEADKVG